MESKSFLSLWYIRVLAVLIMLGIVMALAAYTNLATHQAKYNTMGPTTISVNGTGEVNAKPDIGQFSFSVQAEGADAAEAQSKSAESINAIRSYLTEAGVEDKDIKTQNYNLSPKYRYEDRVCPVGSYCPPGEPIIDGYQVSQSITVKVRDLDSAGALISGVGERGATNISNLSFTIDDESVLKAEAREAAIADAKEKAERLADDLDVDLVRIISFWEDENNPPVFYGYGGDTMMEAKSMSASPEMPTGENTITSNISITYEIK